MTKPNGDLLEALVVGASLSGGFCKWGRLIASMPPEDQAALAAAIDAGVRAPTIHRVFKDRGTPGLPSDKTIQKHIAGVCPCVP